MGLLQGKVGLLLLWQEQEEQAGLSWDLEQGCALAREKESESLRLEAWALLRRRNSANLSLEPGLGAIERGEDGEENSSGISSGSSPDLLFLPREKGEVALDTLDSNS